MTNETEQRPSRILLVDDHSLVREQLAALLRREADLEVCGEAADGPTALSLVTRHEPDLVILDVSPNRSPGLALLKDLKQLRPKLPVLVLSMHDEMLYAERALRAGAAGYLSKEEAVVNVLAAVRKVLTGQTYVNERTAQRMLRKTANGAGGEPGLPVEMLPEAGGKLCNERVQP